MIFSFFFLSSCFFLSPLFFKGGSKRTEFVLETGMGAVTGSCW